MRLRRLATAAGLVAVGAAAFAVVTALLGDPAPMRERPAAGASGERPTRAAAPVRASGSVRSLARSLSLEARVAQLFLVGFEGTDGAAPIFASMQQRGWGAIVLGPENVLWPEAVGALAGQLTSTAAAAGHARPLVMVDGLPALPDQRALRSAAEAEATARAAATGLAALGADAVLDPQADLAVPAGPAAKLGFSDEPRVVRRLARAAVKGWLAGGVLPAVGHFPGQGAASQDPVEGPSIVGAEPEVAAFRPALRRAPAVVISNAAYTVYDSVTPAALLPAVVRDLLRGELRFNGVAITDDLAGATAATGGSVGAAAVEALRAGADLVQVRDEQAREAAYVAVLRAARTGRIPRARIEEAVLRVLVMKERAELL